MKRYFRITIVWNRESASEAIEIDVPDGMSDEEAISMATEAMWNDIINNNINSHTKEITKTEYEEG